MNLSSRNLSHITGVQSFGADVDSATVSRYQPGGDLYGSLKSSYGQAAADRMASAAASGSRSRLNNSMAELRGAPVNTGSTSTVNHFLTQLRTDPLKAPMAAALGQGSSGPGLGSNTTGKILKGAAVIAVVALALYGYNTVKGR